MPMRRRSERLVLIGCRAPISLRNRLVKLARRDGRSQSDYLRRLLEQAIKDLETKAEQPAA